MLFLVQIDGIQRVTHTRDNVLYQTRANIDEYRTRANVLLSNLKERGICFSTNLSISWTRANTFDISLTRNPASRASKRARLVAIRASSYAHRICNFKDCKEGIYFMFFESVL